MARIPGWVSFDLASDKHQAVDVRASTVAAVDSDADNPNVCTLRLGGGVFYRVIGQVDEIILDLTKAEAAEVLR